jgi:hypothetical protein
MEVNNDFLVIQFNDQKKIVDISLYENSNNLKTISQCECGEVEVTIDILYEAEYWPRVYYTIYTIKINNKDTEFLLLEQLDVSFFFILNFYPCSDFNECKEKIEKLQESLTYSSRGKKREAYVVK